MVYVDNVIEAIGCALHAPVAAVGQAFLISEPDQLSWFDFYNFFARQVNASVEVAPYPSVAGVSGGSSARWTQGATQILKSAELRGFAKKIMATDPFGVIPRRLWERSPALQKRVLSAVGVDQAVIYRAPSPSTPAEVRFRIEPTTVVFEKAVQELGYRGTVPRSTAMALTFDWARYARLL